VLSQIVTGGLWTDSSARGPLFLFSLVPYLEAQSATIRSIFDQVDSRVNNHTGHRALTRGERIKDRISLLYCWIIYRNSNYVPERTNDGGRWFREERDALLLNYTESRGGRQLAWCVHQIGHNAE
jgi:hypothetical protein